MAYCIRKAKYRWVHDLWSTDFAIIISTSNTRGFAAFLPKYTYNNYILHILHNYIIYNIYMYICLKWTQFLKINAGNSLSEGTPLPTSQSVDWGVNREEALCKGVTYTASPIASLGGYLTYSSTYWRGGSGGIDFRRERERKVEIKKNA